MNAIEKEATFLKTTEVHEKVGQLAEDLRQLVELQVAQLLHVQEDLHNFSYAVSHDLRAPLRAIDGFSKALSKKLAGKLEKDEERCLQIVMENTARMGRLIDDLLAFYRIGRKEVKISVIETEPFVRSVFEELVRGQEMPGKIELKINALGEMTADRELMKEAFFQLLNNAIKFSSNQDRVIIEVGEKKKQGERLLYIRDNGVGFEMKFADKMFSMFHRLHAADEFSGTGAGLAVVRRIIDMHQGRIWADAQPDKGATFYFSIPYLPNQ